MRSRVIILFAKCYSVDQIKQNAVAGQVACLGEKRNTYRGLFGTLREGQIETARHRSEDNINTGF